MKYGCTVSSANSVKSQARLLEEQVTAFVRAFGLHRPDTTPCGQPMSTSEAHALSELARRAPVSQQGLAGLLRLDKSTVSRLLRRMEERGWVRREPDPGDGRAARLVLTSAGVEAASRLHDARAEKFRTLLEAIPEHGRAPLLDALTTLAQALAETSDPEER